MSRKPIINSPAAIVDAGRARFWAVGQGHQQVGQLGVAMLLKELCHGVAPAPGAWAAGDRERLPGDVG